MKIKIKTESVQEVEIKFLQVDAGARYFEDATVNGTTDTEGELMPFIEGERWKPKIEIETGKIIDWPQGTTASVHYKVCDDGSYFLEDENGNTVISIVENYVPDCLCPKDAGYGDYIIMDIDENGVIQNWEPYFDDFQKDGDEDDE